MLSFGYLKDCIALVFFPILFTLVMNDYKQPALILISLAFVTDFIFTVYPSLHNSNISDKVGNLGFRAAGKNISVP